MRHRHSQRGPSNLRCALALGGLLAVLPIAASSVATPLPQTARAADDVVIGGERGRDLDQLVRSFTNEDGEPFWGTVIVARDGNIMLANGYGKADHETRAMTPRHLFDVGSIAKQFTAAAIFRLEMDGLLSINDPITRHLSPRLDADDAASLDDITIHHLLTHTSGIPNRLSFKNVDLFECDETIEYILASAIYAEPGQEFAYNNIGYFLLAALIEEVSGQTFEHYLRSAVFEPSGMLETGFVLDEFLSPEWETARIFPWRDRMLRGTTLISSWNWANRGATGVVTTVRDLHQWSDALRRHRVLDEATTNRFFSTQHAGYAYGWYIEHTPRGTVRAQHSGATRGYAAQYTMGIDEDYVIAVLSNRDHDVRALALHLEQAAFPSAAPPIALTIHPRTLSSIDERGHARLTDDLAIDVGTVFSPTELNEVQRSTDRIAVRLVDRARRQTPCVIEMESEACAALSCMITEALARGTSAPTDWSDGPPLHSDERGRTNISAFIVLDADVADDLRTRRLGRQETLAWRVDDPLPHHPLTLRLIDLQQRTEPLTITLPRRSAARLADRLREYGTLRSED